MARLSQLFWITLLLSASVIYAKRIPHFGEPLRDGPNAFCAKYSCHADSVTFSDDTCVFFNRTTSDFGLQACPDNYVCGAQLDPAPIGNYTCHLKEAMPPITVGPGEKCSATRKCMYGTCNKDTKVCDA
jgi:hypothetical protein